jgi:trehalose/maltose hydrolase-like predicted phosphorylase
VHAGMAQAVEVNSSLYNILISLHDGFNYSTSPGGLSSLGYDGHVFWCAFAS